MLAQNADVEWTLGQFGKEGVGTNRITTSHSDWSESGMNSYLYTNPSQVMELRNKVHNHPNGNLTLRLPQKMVELEVIWPFCSILTSIILIIKLITLYIRYVLEHGGIIHMIKTRALLQ
jgi:hypothetical protein